MQKWFPENRGRQRAGEEVFPIEQCKIANLRTGNVAQFCFGYGKRIPNHGKEGNYDQGKQKYEAEHNDNVEWVADYVSKLIFEAFP